MRCAVTVSLVPEARGGPFVFWDGLSKGCARAAEIGFDGIEVFPRSPDEVDWRRLESLMSEHDVKLAAAGTGGGWVVHKLSLTSPEAEIRERAKNFALEIIERAGGLGAPAIVGSMQGRWEGPVTREQALAWLGEALEQLAERAAKFNVPILLEPLNRYETNLLNGVTEAVSFLKSLKNRNIKLLGDLFHMNIEEVDIASAIHAAGSRLGHVHFADSNRRAVGFGHTDIESIVAALREVRYDGWLSAEILPLPDSETAAAQTIKAFRQYAGY
ncbi:MAG: sugar phosphate isomerase/epimerase [Verrucomicrobia subdivision 3 bacterium]|nr:sugar phosphate isomerase/epimerase [Limisphaerales bacterium]